MNLAEEFESRASGPILAAVVSEPPDQPWGKAKPDYVGKLLSWEKARPILDYEYNNAFDGDECHAAFVWTETQVLFTNNYDRLIGIREIPRNPTAGVPEFGALDQTKWDDP